MAREYRIRVNEATIRASANDDSATAIWTDARVKHNFSILVQRCAIDLPLSITDFGIFEECQELKMIGRVNVHKLRRSEMLVLQG